MSDESRSAMIRHAMARGISREDANTAYDLTSHAAGEGMRTVIRIAATAPPAMRLSVLTGAYASLAMELKRIAPDVFQALADLPRDQLGTMTLPMGDVDLNRED